MSKGLGRGGAGQIKSRLDGKKEAQLLHETHTAPGGDVGHKGVLDRLQDETVSPAVCPQAGLPSLSLASPIQVRVSPWLLRGPSMEIMKEVLEGTL